MKKLIIPLLVFAGVYACNTHGSGDGGSYPICVTGGVTPCSSLPVQVKEVITAGYSTNMINFTDTAGSLDSFRQTQLDVYSWQTFIALNWPSDAKGNPLSGGLGDSAGASRVWEHYVDPLEAFNYPPEGHLVLHLGEARQAGSKDFYMASKVPSDVLFSDIVVNAFEESVDNKPLIDRYLNYTLYEVKMNHVEADFIKQNNLSQTSAIYKYAGGNRNGFLLPGGDSATGNPGALEIKASWRIMTAQDDASKFYCRSAIIYIDSAHTVNHKPLLIRNVKVGLVGMHIIRNSPNVAGSNLVWSTFEHDDNCPTADTTTSSSKVYSYFNPKNPAERNKAPQHIAIDGGRYIWDTIAPYAQLYQTAGGYGTQVVRVDKIYKFTDSVNNHFRNAVKGTVWQNYKLIGTQWKHGDGPPSGAISAPPHLANTTMETYIQRSSDCIGCHGGANITFSPTAGTTDTINTNFSFLFTFYAHQGVLKK